jgi:eukaryotic-like serine/threonine-protein kinase
MTTASTVQSVTHARVAPPGTIIGRRYRVVGLIAEGSMGVVYRGWHLVLEQPITIKVLRSEYARQPAAAARFLSEARVMAELRGIHVARVLDTGCLEGGLPYIVLEHLVGRDLRAVLAAEGPLALPRAVDYMLQVCEAMAEVHALGIVHRDLKPDNLFLNELPDGTNVLKVIDFGISKRLGTETCSMPQGRSYGSPQYMAPEQVASPETVDARADIWSLGIVFFEFLTNRVPFNAPSVSVTGCRVLSEEPTPLSSLRPDLPPELDGLLGRCLCKSREGRFATVRELAEALLVFGPEEPCLESVERVRHILGSVHPRPDELLPGDRTG